MSAASIAVVDDSQLTASVSRVGDATNLVVRIATDLDIVDDTSARQAEELLQRIARERKEADAQRREWTDPLNDLLRRTNQTFKSAMAPYDQADNVLRTKVRDYRAEQERRRQEEAGAERRRQEEEQRRLDEERRAAEAAARAEREAAAREAARREEEARRAERERREQMEREAGERARYVAGLADADLRALVGSGDAEHAGPAQDELDARAAARKAKEEAAAARQREEDARLAEQAAREAPRAVAAAPVAIAKPAASPVSSKKVWKAEIVDETRIPREYLTVDMVAINKAVRSGVRAIAGVDIRQHDQLAVRSAA